ncbi:hypothetical protein NLU14_08860 [Marinobacter sp. 71-i]|uniref:Uncharacterized protein n=1 Tax=Marinobacter iranensis TaxID=2962607 RepID=A0ABT5YBB0_9GAMM|nr:hypothetical protein [Marinobacter iranensis]MDF0750340.1 hypothetical protein [Marinobacter iranensis]
MSEFKREERYIVIKRKHLSPLNEARIRETLATCGAPTIGCVVVEADWPNYEYVWQTVEQVANGTWQAARAQGGEAVAWLMYDEDGRLFGASANEDTARRFGEHSGRKCVPCYANPALVRGSDAVAYGWFEAGKLASFTHDPEEADELAAEQGAAAFPLYTHPSASVPEGWKLVPIKPTAEMCRAFHKADEHYHTSGSGWSSPDYQWKSMLDEAPQPPQRGKGDD